MGVTSHFDPIDWQALSDLWSSQEAQDLLFQPSGAPEESELLLEMLNATRHIVASVPIPITDAAIATEAVACHAYVTLVRLAHWLQQQQLQAAHGKGESAADLAADWCLFTRVMLAISGAVASAVGPEMEKEARSRWQPPRLNVAEKSLWLKDQTRGMVQLVAQHSQQAANLRVAAAAAAVRLSELLRAAIWRRRGAHQQQPRPELPCCSQQYYEAMAPVTAKASSFTH